MRLMDVMTAPWAITVDMLNEIRGIYETHLRGDKIDIDGVEARLGHSLNNERENYQVIKGVAVIETHGVIAKRMNMFSRISGGVSTQLLEKDINEALEDPEVKAIILDIDSPGGTVDGTFELADSLHEMRGSKPIVSLANGLMASAAYAIGSAADKVYISGPTTMVGSIGVVSTHTDYSGYEEKIGVKTTEIYAGKYKRIASQHAPLTQDGRESMQEHVDYLYSVFVEKVATFRGVPVRTVLDDMADGRLFIGQQAIDAGLVDGVSTLDNLIAELSEGRLPETSSPSGAAEDEIELSESDNETDPEQQIITQSNEEPEMEITKGLIAEQHPEIAEAFRAEGAATANAEGAEQERQRIKDVFAQSMPGHESLINEMAFDGKTTGPEAAVAILQAEKNNQKKVVSDLEADAATVSDVGDSADTDDSVETDSDLPVDQRCQANWDKSKTLRASFGNDFDSYVAYQTAVENGQVKVLGGSK